MATPTVTLTTDKPAYAPGELIRATIEHADTDRATLVLSGSYADSSGVPVTVSATVEIDRGEATLSSSPSRTWTPVEQTAGRTVFTATA